MTRDQFLVEQEGGDITEQYGCYADYAFEPTACVMDTNEHHDCRFARKGMDKTQCKKWVKVPKYFPDFSGWENMGRLLELASSKFVLCTLIGSYIKVAGGKTIRADHFSDIPDITATLIAQALGFEEVKK